MHVPQMRRMHGQRCSSSYGRVFSALVHWPRHYARTPNLSGCVVPFLVSVCDSRTYRIFSSSTSRTHVRISRFSLSFPSLSSVFPFALAFRACKTWSSVVHVQHPRGPRVLRLELSPRVNLVWRLVAMASHRREFSWPWRTFGRSKEGAEGRGGVEGAA